MIDMTLKLSLDEAQAVIDLLATMRGAPEETGELTDSEPAHSHEYADLLMVASPAAIQTAAEATYQRSLAAGNPMSALDLGAQYGRGQRWGYDRIAAVKARARQEADPALLCSCQIPSS